MRPPVRLSASGTLDGARANGPVLTGSAATNTVGTGTDAGVHQAARRCRRGPARRRPTPTGCGRSPVAVSSLLATYSLILALFLGTMGLPHVLVRFYTNPNGSAARRTTLHVLLLLGLFYLFPTAARRAVPAVRAGTAGDRPDRRGDPAAAGATGCPGTVGQVLGARDRGGRVRRVPVDVVRADGERGRGAVDGTAAGPGAGLPGGHRDRGRGAARVGVVLPPTDVSLSVGLSFALAASTFCPVLLLGIWWRRLTWVGAAAGMRGRRRPGADRAGAEHRQRVHRRLGAVVGRAARADHRAGRVRRGRTSVSKATQSRSARRT